MSNMDPLAWLEAALCEHSQRVFLATAAGRVIRFGELDSETRRMVATLRSLGVTRGDRVTAQAEKSPEFVLLYVACLRMGAVFMPLNPAYTPAELEYFIADAEPRVLITAPQLSAAASTCRAAAQPTHVTMDSMGGGSFNVATRSHAPDALPGPFHGDELAALVYTSGTTGRSKGAMLTRANLGTNAQSLAKAWAFTADDVLLHALPVFHVHGLFMAINTALVSGASLLFLSKFDADDVLQHLPRASVFMGVPTYYTRLLQRPGLSRESAANLRLFISGSAPLLPETHRAFEARTGHMILERYGMTETLINASNPYLGKRLPGSVGPALPGVELRIANANTGEAIAAPGAIGSIEIRGPNVFKGYWRAPEKTAADFRANGFFISGDLGFLDAAGYLHIAGRSKDLIITGGSNVYPIEIEEAIDALPGISESAVIGLPHADFGEAVTAIVVAEPGAAQSEHAILNQLKQSLAKFKLPKHIIFSTELPRNAMGKVQKQLLRASYARLYD
jgi:malonyl-CoA/methylmalonyl-CoA synthetase